MNGILNVYKEAGWTSHDVVAKLRGILKQKKIGHTGTLDPDAVGVLPVCLGKATKVCGMLTDARKTYEATLLLGRETDTQDGSGEVLAQRDVTCDEAQVRAATESFLGDQMQIPPMYSAIKQDGKRLYELARAGQVVERPARPVTFFEIDVLDVSLPRVQMRVTCSKGTYIRTLCHDIGQKLGCGGCMEHLVRTGVGPFEIGTAHRLEELQQMQDKGVIRDAVIPVDALFAELPAVTLPPALDTPAHSGNPLPGGIRINGDTGTTDICESGTARSVRPGAKKIRAYDSAGRWLGLYRYRADRNDWKPDGFFYDPEEDQ